MTTEDKNASVDRKVDSAEVDDPVLGGPDAASDHTATMFALLFNEKWYSAQSPAIRLALEAGEYSSAASHYRSVGGKQLYSPSPYFDAKFYQRFASSVRDEDNLDPIAHYVRFGVAKRASPHWLFDENFYLSAYSDVVSAIAAGDFLSGYMHFLLTKNTEFRRPHPLFSRYCYEQQNGPVAGNGAFEEFLRSGQYFGKVATPLFDWDWYAEKARDKAVMVGPDKEYQSLYHHFAVDGIGEGRSCVPDFDDAYYLAAHPDVAAAIKQRHLPSAIFHWLYNGIRQGYNPNRYFDSRYYLEKNPEVKKEINTYQLLGAFEHFLAIGRRKGLKCNRPMVSMDVSEDQSKALFAKKAAIVANQVKRIGIDFDSTQKPRVSAVVPVHNEFDYTAQVLAELKCKGGAGLEVIVVDDKSSDETLDLAKYAKNVTVLRQEVNLGFPGACNVGWRAARADTVLFLNNDIELGFGAIDAAYATLWSSDDIGAVGGRIIRTHGQLQEAGSIVWASGGAMGYGRDEAPDSAKFSAKRDVDFCSACFLMVKRQVLEAISGFDEAFSPGYFEEVDLCSRIWASNKRVVYDPAVYVYHFEYASFSKGRPPSASFSLMMKHRNLYRKKHADFLKGQVEHAKTNLHLAADRQIRQGMRRILFVEDMLPLAQFGSGFGRAQEILDGLVSLGYDVTVATVVKGGADDDDCLRKRFPKVDVQWLGEHGMSIKQLMRGRADTFDVVWMCRTHNVKRFRDDLTWLANESDGVRLVLDTEAIATNRLKAQAVVAGDERWSEAFFQNELRKELDGCEVFDTIIAVNDAEARQVKQLVPGSRSVVVSHPITVRQGTPGYAERKGFLFVGAVHSTEVPNYDSVLWMARHVWPLIAQRLPDAELTIAGYWRDEISLPPELTKPGIRFLGRQESLQPLYDQARVFVAPTRYGAGIPIKVYDSLENGVPVILTKLLFEQLGWNNLDGIVVPEQDSPEAFADACVNLYLDIDQWNRIRELGGKRAESIGHTEAVREILKSITE